MDFCRARQGEVFLVKILVSSAGAASAAGALLLVMPPTS